MTTTLNQAEAVWTETEIDETTNEVRGVYPCGCVQIQRLRWGYTVEMGRRSISARPSISSDTIEPCELHR